MITQHIHHAHLWDANLEEVWALGHAGTYEQASVASAEDGEVILVGISVVDEPFASRDEVIEHILLLHLGTSQVPVFAILASTTEHYVGIDATILQEWDARRGESRCKSDVETAIAIEQQWILTVEFDTLFTDNEHRYTGSVLAVEKYLSGFKPVLVESCLRCHEYTALVVVHVILIDCAG